MSVKIILCPDAYSINVDKITVLATEFYCSGAKFNSDGTVGFSFVREEDGKEFREAMRGFVNVTSNKSTS